MAIILLPSKNQVRSWRKIYSNPWMERKRLRHIHMESQVRRTRNLD